MMDRPRSHERGNNLITALRPLASWVGFNGAAFSRTRKRGRKRWRRWYAVDLASMGPRSHERGNILESSDVVLTDKASMGPRSHERGNILESSDVVLTDKASMGPRSHERGNGLDGDACLVQPLASMGPRSHERGNQSTPPRNPAQRRCFNGAAFSRTRKPHLPTGLP